MITFDQKAKRFRDAQGRFISLRIVQQEIEKGLIVTQDEMEALAKQLEDEKITIDQWQVRMGILIASSMLLGHAVGLGGRRAMTQADYGYLGSQVKEQYKFLNRTADRLRKGFKLSQVAKDRITVEGSLIKARLKGKNATRIKAAVKLAEAKQYAKEQFVILKRRVRLYAFPFRQLYYKGEVSMYRLSGHTESIRIRTVDESCKWCVLWAAKGWVPIDDQPPIGSFSWMIDGCFFHDKCFLKYR